MTSAEGRPSIVAMQRFRTARTRSGNDCSAARPVLRAACRMGAWVPLWLAVCASPLQAAESLRQDNRSVTVEATLKDLSRANDAAITGEGLTAVPGRDGTGQPRTDLLQPRQPDTEAVVAGEVQSSLHKLKRETVIRQTPDDRQVLIEDTQNRNREKADPGS